MTAHLSYKIHPYRYICLDVSKAILLYIFFLQSENLLIDRLSIQGMAWKAELIYWDDIALLVSFLLVGATGIVKFLLLRGWLSLALNFRVLNAIHDYAGVVMVLAAALHLVLHWNWIVSTTKRKLGLGQKD